MNRYLSNHRYISLLFLILSTQSLFTDLKRSEEHFSSLYATFTCKREDKDKNNQIDPDQKKRSFFIPTKEFYEKNKRFFESQKTFNNYPIYIPKYLKDEEENQSSETVKDMPSHDISNLESHNGLDVRMSMMYVAAVIKDRVAKIATIAKKTAIDTTLVIPVALVNAYHNRKGLREEREFLEYDFDHIEQITNRTYKPYDQVDHNTVYSLAAGCKVAEFIAEGVVVGTVATINFIKQPSNEEPKKEAQQKEEKKQEQSPKESESNVTAKETTAFKNAAHDSAKKETTKESKVSAKDSSKEVKSAAKESATSKEVVKDFAKKETAKESRVSAKDSSKEAKTASKESAMSKEVVKDSAKKETAKESRVTAKDSSKEAKTASKESATSKEVVKDSAKKETTKESKITAKESVKEIPKESIKKNIEFSQSDVAAIAQKDSERAKLKAGQEAIKAYQDQRAEDREKQDRVIEAGISFAIVSWLMPYEQQQKAARKEKVREDCIQKRMVEENKTRAQIEEEIRLASEQCYQEQREKELRAQEEEKRLKEEKQRLKEEKLEEKKQYKQLEKEKKQKQREEELRALQAEKELKEETLEEKKKHKQREKEKKQGQNNNNKKHNGSGPDKDPDKEPDYTISSMIATAKKYTEKIKDKFDKLKNKQGNPNNDKPCLQKDTRNYKPTQAEVLENQRWQNEYTNGKGVYESNAKHHPNARKGIGPEPDKPLDALRDSLYVDEDLRVAVQDGKIVMLRKHGETAEGFPIYHSYIEEDMHKVKDARKVLQSAGLIHPKTGEVYRRWR